MSEFLGLNYQNLNPKQFWQAIKDLKNDNVNEVNPLSAIDNSTWHDYFSRLYPSSDNPQTSDIESCTEPPAHALL